MVDISPELLAELERDDKSKPINQKDYTPLVIGLLFIIIAFMFFMWYIQNKNFNNVLDAQYKAIENITLVTHYNNYTYISVTCMNCTNVNQTDINMTFVNFSYIDNYYYNMTNLTYINNSFYEENINYTYNNFSYYNVTTIYGNQTA